MGRETKNSLKGRFSQGSTPGASDFGTLIDSNFNLEEAGTQIASGSLKLYGNITATEYIISSSVTNRNVLNVSGSTHFGDDITDTHTRTGSMSISGSVTMTGEIQPSADAVYSLGSPSKKFKELYLSTGSLFLGGVQIGAEGDEALMLSGSGQQYFLVKSSNDRAGLNIHAGAANKNSNIWLQDFKSNKMFIIGARNRPEGDLFYISSGSSQSNHHFIYDGETGNIGIGHGYFGTNPTRPSHTVELSGSSINIDATAVYITGSINSSGTVRISDAYTLPTSDGDADQVLATDGVGTITFVAQSGGGGGGGSNTISLANSWFMG